MNIDLYNFPHLRLIAWNMRDLDTMEGQEAFSHYERNWRFVAQTQLSNHKRELIERLAGLMNV